MKILVTGQHGYLASVLIPKLEGLGNTIIGFLGLVQAHRNWVDAPTGCDAVIHLAAYNDLYGCEANPLKSFYVNYWGTMLAMKYCVENSAKLIFPSTGTVLGLDGTGPISVYDAHKLSAEKSIMLIPNGESAVLRLSTVYGPSPAKSQQANRGIINRWCGMALGGETLKVYDSVADTLRQYIFVNDVVDALVKAMDAPKGSYTIDTGVSTSVIDMASQIVALSGGNGKVEIVPSPEGLHPIEERNETGNHPLFGWYTQWKPKTSVVDGIHKTLEYYRTQQ